MPLPSRLSVRTIVKSAGVGAVSSFIDLAMMAVLVSGFAFSARVASPIALGAGLSFQFVGNKLFAFDDKRARWGKQAAQFAMVEAVAFLANLALFDVAVRAVPLPYLLVRILTQSAVYFGLSLPLWSRVFERGGREVAS